ncbi:MAG: hypothetical protein OHK0019_03670 [Saprospiraceae bacterium]
MGKCFFAAKNNVLQIRYIIMYIRILAFLLFFQSLISCQGEQGATTNLALSAIPDKQQASKKSLPTTANIVFQSIDGGQTWNDVSEGLPERIAVGRVFAAGDEIYLASESGLYQRSVALVAPSWEKESFLSEKVTNIFPGQNGLYISSYKNGFFKGIPGTGIWTPMHNALEDKTVRTVLETSHGSVFVGCESGIYKSTDGGGSWKHVFADNGVNSLAASGDVLLCGGYKGLLRSTDGGENWNLVLANEGSAFNTKRIEGGFITATDGGLQRDGKPNKLYTSTDEGKTWQRIDTGLSLVWDIYDIAQAGAYLFCSTDAGISRSADGGQTWELILPRTDEQRIFHLAVAGEMIFAVLVFGC